jgi:hypothetical protein
VSLTKGFMKALNVYELKEYSQWLQQQLEGAQLQDVWMHQEILILQFYRYKDLYLCIDLNQQLPLISLLQDKPQLSKTVKPVVLFLNARAENLHWEKISLSSASSVSEGVIESKVEKGDVKAEDRILNIDLHKGDRHCLLQIILIPKFVNLFVTSDKKSISWLQPRKIPQSHAEAVQDLTVHMDDPMDWWQMGLDWYDGKKNKTKQAQSAAEKLGENNKADPRLKVLQKKKNALLAIDKQLQQDLSGQWQLLGESLKVSAVVPVELAHLYDNKKNLKWNLENSFAQYRLLKKKRQGTADRQQILLAEVQKIELDIASRSYSSITTATQPLPSRAQKIFNKTDVKTRKLELEEGLQAVIGKTAKDNLAILRQAHAWDLWLHLKDYPGAHAIILRRRDQNVKDSVIKQVAQWLYEQSLSLKEKKNQVQLQKLEVVVVEVRFVRPIKGDKLGRVSYHHPQVYNFILQ